jgi:hypothetical protein
MSKDIAFPRFTYNPNRFASFCEGHGILNGEYEVDRLVTLAGTVRERKGSIEEADFFETALRMLQHARRFRVRGEAVMLLQDLSKDQRRLVRDALPMLLANGLPLLRETLDAWGLPPDGLVLECIHD